MLMGPAVPVTGQIIAPKTPAPTAAKPATPPVHRLILKDGSYQTITKYEIRGNRVRYISSERGGDWEELPVDLVDWPATEAWARDHAPGARPLSPAEQEAAEVDKEEKADRAEQDILSPQVAPGLRLPDEDGVWALDTFHDRPELIELKQNTGNVNANRGHNVLRAAMNPLGGTKQLVQIEGPRSKVQFHVNQPSVYVSLDEGEAQTAEPGAHTVDTRGAGAAVDKSNYSSPASRYAIVRVQQKKATRTLAAMNISMLGQVSHSEDIVETTAEILPGKRWLKLTPKQPLDIGEYALMEILSPKEVNLSVWDFGVDPRAPEPKDSRTALEEKP